MDHNNEPIKWGESECPIGSETQSIALCESSSQSNANEKKLIVIDKIIPFEWGQPK
jgi:hypothetical protein